jgi:TldD protein
MKTNLVERDVLERVLASAMERGGEFAEVFVEDRTTTSAVLDQRRIEELSSGRDRGAGIRVVVGDTTGFAHTADLSERGLLAAARSAASVARGGGGGVREVALGALSDHPTRAIQQPGDRSAPASTSRAWPRGTRACRPATVRSRAPGDSSC